MPLVRQAEFALDLFGAGARRALDDRGDENDELTLVAPEILRGIKRNDRIRRCVGRQLVVIRAAVIRDQPADGGALAAVPQMPEAADARIPFTRFPDFQPTPVSAGIIDKYHLIDPACSMEGSRNFAHQRQDIFLLVMDGNNYDNVRGHWARVAGGARKGEG